MESSSVPRSFGRPLLFDIFEMLFKYTIHLEGEWSLSLSLSVVHSAKKSLEYLANTLRSVDVFISGESCHFFNSFLCAEDAIKSKCLAIVFIKHLYVSIFFSSGNRVKYLANKNKCKKKNSKRFCFFFCAMNG